MKAIILIALALAVVVWLLWPVDIHCCYCGRMFWRESRVIVFLQGARCHSACFHKHNPTPPEPPRIVGSASTPSSYIRAGEKIMQNYADRLEAGEVDL